MPFAPAPARSNRREYVAWGLATLAILSALAIAATTRRRAPEPVRVVHATIPVMFELENAPALRFAVSPDGRAVAFTARDASNKTMLWLRPLDGLTAQAIAGTEGASSPFWSPDSRDIAFIATGKLRRVPATGGPVISLADAVQTPPGAWSKNNVILFTPSGTSPLYQLPAGGGTAKPVTTLDRGSTVLHSFPAFLSDGQRFLYARPGDLNRIIAVGSLDGTITKQIELPESGGNVQFASGHLFFLRENTLMAQRFDEATLSLVGNAVPIAESLLTNTTTGGTGAYSVSPNGVLVYQTRATLGGTVTWLDRSGRATGEIGTAGLYGGLTLASDGRSALAAYEDANQRGLVTFDLVRGFGRRLSVNASLLPISWSSDGGLIFYRRRVPNGGTAIYSAPSNGDGAERPLLENERVNMPLAASPDGQHLLYAVSVAPTRAHLWTLPLAGGAPTPYLETLVLPTQADFSPNGHFVAYVSNEGGRNEVWVATFPKSMGKWQVSTNGGMEPRWSANGKELFYASGAKLMATEVDTTSGTLQIGPTHALFDLPRVGTQVYSYDVAADGRFLVVANSGREVTPLSLLINWQALVNPTR